MLTQLTIKNFAIIDELEINFKNSLSVITGETGAGKSIIFEALDFLLGSRVTTDIIKNSTNKALVEGIFGLKKTTVLQDWFLENGFDFSNELIISRELSNQGSKVRINGSLANVSHLVFLKLHLTNIHEQSEHLELLKTENQLSIIDNYGNINHKKILEEYRNAFEEYKTLKLKLNNHRESSKELIKKIGYLKHEINEIKSADIKDQNEENELLAKREALLNKKELIDNANLINEIINHNDSGSGSTYHSESLQSKLVQVKKLLINSNEHDKEFKPYIELIEDIILQMKDLSHFANDYLNNFTSDDLLQEIEERLDLFYKLKKKYGISILEIKDYYNRIQKELKELEENTISEDNLQKSFNKKEQEINILSEKLTKSREHLVSNFVNGLHEELITLGFNKNGETSHPIIVIEFTPCDLSLSGKEQIQFLFSSNPDEPPKPLLKVASGGELSRIMLGIKSVICNNSLESSLAMLFDEIDMGVSGEIASNVAKKLYKISRSNQAICITHQPIIVAMADTHYVIEKNITAGVTQVLVKEISNNERANALAILLTPEKRLKDGITEDAKQFAKSLLENAKQFKEKKSMLKLS